MRIDKLIICALFAMPLSAWAQSNIQVNGFGHLEYELYHKPTTNQNESSFRLGEHDLFVNGRMTNKLSFLSEVVVKSDSKTATGFGPSIERALIKYNYKGEHSLIVGKMHTPLNYWNDVYHHGRLFYPTIDRPFNFDYFMPIHTLGVRASGQNLGKLNFGYDVQVGNSMESTDFGAKDILFSYLASVHIKPWDGTRIMAGYYRDYLPTNSHGTHAHSGANHNHDYHHGLTTNQFCVSVARFEHKLEFLNEFAYILNNTDTLGAAGNITNYTYVGYKIKDKFVPFVMADYLHIAPNELHVKPTSGLKYSLGMRWDIDPKVNLKIQLENYGPAFDVHDVPGLERKYELKLQLAYAI
jgi:hypothetical protein